MDKTPLRFSPSRTARTALLAPDPRLAGLLAALRRADAAHLPPSSVRHVLKVRRWDRAPVDGLVIDGSDLSFGSFDVTIANAGTFECVNGVPFPDGFTAAWAVLHPTSSGLALECHPPLDGAR